MRNWLKSGSRALGNDLRGEPMHSLNNGERLLFGIVFCVLAFALLIGLCFAGGLI